MDRKNGKEGSRLEYGKKKKFISREMFSKKNGKSLLYLILKYIFILLLLFYHNERKRVHCECDILFTWNIVRGTFFFIHTYEKTLVL